MASTVTEYYLKDHYQRYVRDCQQDNQTPDNYAAWREWFLSTFEVTVKEQPPKEN